MARIGADGFGDTSVEGYCREPAEVSPDFGGVYGVASIVAGAVFDGLEQCFRLAQDLKDLPRQVDIG